MIGTCLEQLTPGAHEDIFIIVANSMMGIPMIQGPIQLYPLSAPVAVPDTASLSLSLKFKIRTGRALSVGLLLLPSKILEAAPSRRYRNLAKVPLMKFFEHSLPSAYR